jgi:hypothetical protein
VGVLGVRSNALGSSTWAVAGHEATAAGVDGVNARKSITPKKITNTAEIIKKMIRPRMIVRSDFVFALNVAIVCIFHAPLSAWKLNLLTQQSYLPYIEN